MLNIDVKKARGDFHLEVSAKLDSPGVIALFGPSGCGKTTLIDLIAGLATPDAGVIEFDGETLFDSSAGVNVPPERRGIGYVFQSARLFPHLSVRANLDYGASRAAARPASIDYDDIVALLDIGPLLPRRTHHLSGGEAQRVALARALLSQPRLLLLDEPLASLDEARRNEVLPYLEALRDRLSIPMVYVSHQFEEVLRLATSVVLMQGGRAIAQGAIGETSLSRELHRVIGQDAVGSVVDGTCVSIDSRESLAEISVGRGVIRVPSLALEVGQRVRLRLLARDAIIALEPAERLSVRNRLEGTLLTLESDQPGTVLATIDVGGVSLLARVTSSAANELSLAPGLRVWLLIKSVSVANYAAPR